MCNREYILTIHWKKREPTSHCFWHLSAAFEALKILEDSLNVSYVTMKSRIRPNPTVKELYDAWYQLHPDAL